MKTSERIVREEVNFVGQGEFSDQPVKLVTELKRFTFKNIGASMFYVTPPNSRDTKQLLPGEERDDFTSKDRTQILQSTLYKVGQIVEVFEGDLGEADKNPNSLSDKELSKLLLQDNEDIKEHIIKMDSIFAVDRVREQLLERDMPAHLVGYCDSRINELKAKYEEDNKAPIDVVKGG
jgi:hypothetical protein